MTAVNSQPLNNPWRTPQNDSMQPISLSAQDLAANIKRDIATSIRTMPIVTFLFASIIVGVFILDLFFNLLLKFSLLKSDEIWVDLMYKTFLLSPVKIVKSYQVWRLLTYVYPESGVFRLIIHLLVTVSLSSQFEKRTGSVKYFYLLNAFFILVPALIYSCLASFALSGPKSLPAIADEGNLFFSLLVCQVREAPQSNPCEACNVSTGMYPIALFLIISLFSSRAAITMQFFGLLMGYLYAYEMLALLMPSESRIHQVENMYLVGLLQRIFPHRFVAHSERGFVLFEPTDLPHSNVPGAFGPGQQANPGSGSSFSFFGNFMTPPSQDTNTTNSTFSGQGRRLGS